MIVEEPGQLIDRGRVVGKLAGKPGERCHRGEDANMTV
ncbi:hypothetical protein B7C42_01868 [Nocardia cerradoensis]|uniref:Uncharacterized protein n=1 Tax=Nocardia cerradoensis TaxID=85688 RepID=A0A231HA03_9NOCA|nr:hypothetical protein B7C42_01868 [Nocardia cerradoensis]